MFYDFLGNLDVKGNHITCNINAFMYSILSLIGLYKSCTPDDGFRYKIYQAELGNKILEEQSEKVSSATIFLTRLHMQ